MKLLLCAALLFWAGCASDEPGAADPDILTVAPERVAVLFENDSARVLRVTLPPGEEIGMHRGLPHLVYPLTDYAMNWNFGDLNREKQWSRGEIHWHDAGPHAVRNIGETPAEYLVVERRAPVRGGETSAAVADVAAGDPDFARVLLENAAVRVVEVVLPAGRSQPMHEGLPRMVCALNAYRVTMAFGDGRHTDRRIAAETAHWHDAGAHAVTNTGDTPAHYLVVEFHP